MGSERMTTTSVPSSKIRARHKVAVVLMTATMGLMVAAPSFAASGAKAGAKCTKAGKTSGKLVCTKTKSGLKWAKKPAKKSADTTIAPDTTIKK